MTWRNMQTIYILLKGKQHSMMTYPFKCIYSVFQPQFIKYFIFSLYFRSFVEFEFPIILYVYLWYRQTYLLLWVYPYGFLYFWFSGFRQCYIKNSCQEIYCRCVAERDNKVVCGFIYSRALCVMVTSSVRTISHKTCYFRVVFLICIYTV